MLNQYMVPADVDSELSLLTADPSPKISVSIWNNACSWSVKRAPLPQTFLGLSPLEKSQLFSPHLSRIQLISRDQTLGH